MRVPAHSLTRPGGPRGSRRRSTVLVALMLATTIAVSTALAAPPQIVLQKSDFAPAAKARLLQGEAAGKGGFANYAYVTRGRPNELAVSVAVLPSIGRAQALFVEFRRDALAFPGQQQLRLPSYGATQFATFGRAGSQLVVRTGHIVWMLDLQTFLTRGGTTHELTKAEAIAEYKTYAPKQQLRVRAKESR